MSRKSIKKLCMCLFAPCLIIGMIGVVGLWAIYQHVASSAIGAVGAEELNSVDGATILVLGCSPNVRGGRSNLYFTYRMRAAYALHQKYPAIPILVSGDNSSKFYSEPDAMKAALQKLGVPANRIVCDYAGLRTLDSVVRAKEVFGAQRLLIVSQRSHVERAIYLAQAHDLPAAGWVAEDVAWRGIRVRAVARETLARVLMLADVYLLQTRPRYDADGTESPLSVFQ